LRKKEANQLYIYVLILAGYILDVIYSINLSPLIATDFLGE